MTITLKPELEALIQKRLESGIFQNVEEVLWQALESQNAEAKCLLLHESEVGEKIDRAIAQAERGEGMNAEQSLAWMEERKAAWRNAPQGRCRFGHGLTGSKSLRGGDHLKASNGRGLLGCPIRFPGPSKAPKAFDTGTS